MLDAILILTAWPTLITAAVSFVKRLAHVVGVREHAAFVRLLPVVPELIGVASAPAAIYLLANQITWLNADALRHEPLWLLGLICGWAGIGAGAVSSKGWKAYQQSVRGRDDRLT